MDVPNAAWIRTGAGGRVLLKRDNDTILVAPNTKLALYKADRSGKKTGIRQTFGRNRSRPGETQLRSPQRTNAVHGRDRQRQQNSPCGQLRSARFSRCRAASWKPATCAPARKRLSARAARARVEKDPSLGMVISQGNNVIKIGGSSADYPGNGHDARRRHRNRRQPGRKRRRRSRRQSRRHTRQQRSSTLVSMSASAVAASTSVSASGGGGIDIGLGGKYSGGDDGKPSESPQLRHESTDFAPSGISLHFAGQDSGFIRNVDVYQTQHELRRVIKMRVSKLFALLLSVVLTFSAGAAFAADWTVARVTLPAENTRWTATAGAPSRPAWRFPTPPGSTPAMAGACCCAAAMIRS